MKLIKFEIAQSKDVFVWVNPKAVDALAALVQAKDITQIRLRNEDHYLVKGLPQEIALKLTERVFPSQVHSIKPMSEF